ncbi:MAG: 50S ribosomal protein L29 [Candidatus Yanofskybacteria bacterium]|nr:50S ribosomal protein L29 [Candidatus Yanofskybacteria bacterium]
MDEIQNKSMDELAGALRELRAKLLQIRFDLADNKLKNVRELGNTKKSIARILTRISQLKTESK